MSEPVAIVGLACRYPDADNPLALWDLVLDQRRTFRRLPPERLDLTDYFDHDRAAVDKTYSVRAALLEGWAFDRAAFRIPGPVFRATDPTHWLALETASQVLDDAGYPHGEGLDRDRVGVVIGNTLTGEVTRATTLRLRWPYVRRVFAAAMAEEGLPEDQQRALLERAAGQYLRPFPAVSDETLAGSLSNTIAGRICNHFDFHGGGYTVDGACASSLLAVITACRALCDGSVDFALAGGVDISLDPFELVGFAKAGALAADRMRVYDGRSNGFWPGEGCGVVGLMRAADAHAAGLQVYAEIVGWGVSSDGKGGITRPSRRGQLLALRRAYQRAGVDPASVLFFEGHGTGTAVGDATELAALCELRREAPVPAAIGSIKANIGHTKAAAGVAGLLKATLSVASGVLPATTGCEQPHAVLREKDAPLRVLREPEPWPAGLRRAGVSAMGFGGINTHLVLDAPVHARRRAIANSAVAARRPTPHTDVLVLSGSDTTELRRVLDRLAAIASRLSEAELHDLACQFGRAASSGPLRVALVVETVEQLAERARRGAERLTDLRPGQLIADRGVYLGVDVAGRVTVLLPGQGAPVYPDAGALGRDIPQLAHPHEAINILGNGPVDTAVAQPAIYKSSLAALRWLDRLGVVPIAAIGHSLGEITGLVWTGCLPDADGEHLVRERGRLMSERAASATGMISLAVDAATASALCAGTRLVVAAYNGPRSHVLAGPAMDIQRVADRASRNGVQATVLPVSHAFHSPAVAGCAAAFKTHLETVPFRSPKRRLVSTVVGRTLTKHDSLIDLLGQQITAPVLFWDALREVLADTDLFCEAGPGHSLSSLVAGCCDVPAVSLDAGSPADRPLAEAAGALFAAQAVDDLTSLFKDRPARPIDIWRDRAFLANPCSAAPPTNPALVQLDPVAESAEGGAKPCVAPGDDMVQIVIDLIAAATELDPAAIERDQRLLSDLHLTSLRVTQVVAAAAEAAGRERPMAPLTMADASVADIVSVLESLPLAKADASESQIVPGIAPWVRCFVEKRQLIRRVGPPAVIDSWRTYIVPGQPLSRIAEETFGIPSDGPVDLAYIPDLVDPAAIAVLLATARAAIQSKRLVVVTHSSGLSGFLRSIQQEHPELGITLLRTNASRAGLRHAARHATVEPGRWQEIVLDGRGHVMEPALRPVPLAHAADLPVGPGDVLLVSGGGKGIGYECAAALANASGAALALVGRSHPDADEILRTNLTRLQEAGIRLSYEPADVTDADALAVAVRRLEECLGPVTALLHASGVNEPRRFVDLTEREVHSHLGPKIAGLHNLLSATQPDQLRLLVTFGSVIGRYGLGGECHYALANGALRAEAERLTTALPGCRVLNLDWSVWTGPGMGERLGVVDSLLRLDVTPIPGQDGVALFLQLLAAPWLPTTVTVQGRVGGLAEGGHPEPTGRFLERTRVHYPGVELVAEAQLDLRTDPYLADHRIDGLSVLPAVVGLEAMAQAASTLAGRSLRQAHDIVLSQPVVVPEDRPRIIRLCALRQGNAIETVLRSEESGFRIDHFRAVFPLRASRHPLRTPPVVHGDLSVSQEDLYGPLYFHEGRFRRVVTMSAVRARCCRASIHTVDDMPWFTESTPPLLLGSPGVNDATIHVLQACVPHRRLLPVSCDRLVVTTTASAGLLEVRAAERHARDGEYVWDVAAVDEAGQVVITWTGLRLKDVGPLPRSQSWTVPLLAVHLERSATGLGLDPTLQVEISTNGKERAIPVVRPPYGVSRSHLDELTLIVQAEETVACDWERVVERSAEEWHSVLGSEFDQMLNQLRARCAETPSMAATRIWTAIECLSKIGRPPSAPLVVRGVYEGGWVLFRNGDDLIASTLVRATGIHTPVAIAILAGASHAAAQDV